MKIKAALLAVALLAMTLWTPPAKANGENYVAEGYVRTVTTQRCWLNGCTYTVIMEGGNGVVFSIPLFLNAYPPVWQWFHGIVTYGDSMLCVGRLPLLHRDKAFVMNKRWVHACRFTVHNYADGGNCLISEIVVSGLGTNLEEGIKSAKEGLKKILRPAPCLEIEFVGIGAK